MRSSSNPQSGERGMALVLVLILLGVLAVVATPFAVSMMLQERTGRSYQLDQQARLAAEGARNHAVVWLMQSHECRERLSTARAPFNTPDVDTSVELRAPWNAPGDLSKLIRLDDPKGAIWSVRVEDEQGKIDLRSAPPWVIRNLRAIVDPAMGDLRRFVTEESTVSAPWACARSVRRYISNSDGSGRPGAWPGPGWPGAGSLVADIFMDDTDGYAAGSAVRFRRGGETFEAICIGVRNRFIRIDRIPPESITRIPSQIEAWTRHPVNVNTAPREVLAACFTGLSDGGRQPSTLTTDRAMRIAERFVRRTFDDVEEVKAFMDTLVSEKVATPAEADFIVANARASWDWTLDGTGTMPFCYRTGDVYTIEGAGLLNDSAGNQRAAHVARTLASVAPPGPLAWTMASQADFERERLAPSGAWITTFPVFVRPGVRPSKDAGAGTGDVRSLAAEDERGSGIVVEEHFPESQEGAAINDGYRIAGDALFGTAAPDILPGGVEFWIRFRQVPAGRAVLFDAGDRPWENRVTLFHEGNDLVLRVCDATLDRMAAQIRATGVAFEPEVWYHLGAYWGGTEYPRLALMLDGKPVGRFAHVAANDESRDILGHLTGALGGDATAVFLDGGGNFPDPDLDEDGDPIPVAIRIGDEWMGYTAKSGSRLVLTGALRGGTVTYRSTGGAAWRGSSARPHPSGVAVRLGGYSLPLKDEQIDAADIEAAFTQAINDALGCASSDERDASTLSPGRSLTLAVLRAGGTPVPRPTQEGVAKGGRRIWRHYERADRGFVVRPFMAAFTGLGFHPLATLSPVGRAFRPSGLAAVPRPSGSGPQEPSDVNRATFSPDTAASVRTGTASCDGRLLAHPAPPPPPPPPRPFGTVSLSGIPFVEGATIDAISASTTENVVGTSPLTLSNRALIATGLNGGGGTLTGISGDPAELARYPSRGYLLIGTPIHDRLVQSLTQGEAAGMEIVYYASRTGAGFAGIERFQFGTNSGQLPLATSLAFSVAGVTAPILDSLPAMVYSIPMTRVDGYPSPAIVQIDDEWILAEPFQRGGESYLIGIQAFQGAIPLPLDRLRFQDGLPANGPSTVDLDLLRGFPLHGVLPGGATADAFAGPRDHPAGSLVLPVFAVSRPEEGRGDRCTIVERTPGRKEQLRIRHAETIDIGGTRHLAAFWSAASKAYLTDGGGTHLLKFPSGELLRVVPGAAVVGAAGAGLGVSGDLDEIRGFRTGARDGVRLAAAVNANGQRCRLDVGGAIPPGAIKLGDEWMVATSGSSGQSGGAHRAWLGSPVAPHDQGEMLFLLPFLGVSTLSRAMTATEARIPIVSSASFPENGVVRIGDELLVYSSEDPSTLEMPVGVRGVGLFRGAFGTVPAAHPIDEPVFAHPYRYQDRFAEDENDSDLQCFEAAFAARGAEWDRIGWEAVAPDGVRLRVQVRIDGAPGWETHPTNRTGGIFEFTEGKGRNRIDLRGDRIEVRVYTEILPGAFGASAWKATPILDSMKVEYSQPTLLWGHEGR